MTDRHLIIVAALILLIGVGTGAFGAHGLKRTLGPDRLAVWQTAVTYQMIHGLGLLAIAALEPRFGSPLLAGASIAMLIGIALFSGSLYLLAVTRARWLGAITPAGGLAFIVSWAMVALAVYRHA